MKILKVEELSYNIGSGKDILKNLSFTLDKGETLGIIGESGAGKTTLAKILAGLLAPSKGKISFDVTQTLNANAVQILFQNTGDIINPFRKVNDIITETAKVNMKQEKAAEEYALHLMDLFHIQDDLREKRGYELSGGEQQRTALARILASKPEILILDEPFAAQDAASQHNLLSHLTEVKKEFGLSIICISHTIKLLKDLADKIIVLRDGEITEQGDNPAIFINPLHWYTKLLLKAEAYELSSQDKEALRMKRPAVT